MTKHITTIIMTPLNRILSCSSGIDPAGNTASRSKGHQRMRTMCTRILFLSALMLFGFSFFSVPKTYAWTSILYNMVECGDTGYCTPGPSYYCKNDGTQIWYTEDACQDVAGYVGPNGSNNTCVGEAIDNWVENCGGATPHCTQFNNDVWCAQCDENSHCNDGNSCTTDTCNLANCSHTNNPVNGACGTSSGQSFSTAPSTNLCASGSPSAVSGIGPWTWTCAGSCSGSTANCSAGIINGNIGSSNWYNSGTGVPGPINYGFVSFKESQSRELRIVGTGLPAGTTGDLHVTKNGVVQGVANDWATIVSNGAVTKGSWLCAADEKVEDGYIEWSNGNTTPIPDESCDVNGLTLVINPSSSPSVGFKGTWNDGWGLGHDSGSIPPGPNMGPRFTYQDTVTGQYYFKNTFASPVETKYSSGSPRYLYGRSTPYTGISGTWASSPTLADETPPADAHICGRTYIWTVHMEDVLFHSTDEIFYYTPSAGSGCIVPDTTDPTGSVDIIPSPRNNPPTGGFIFGTASDNVAVQQVEIIIRETQSENDWDCGGDRIWNGSAWLSGCVTPLNASTNNSWATWYYQNPTSFVSTKWYKIFFRVTDTSGNQTDWVAGTQFLYDDIPPVIDVTSLSNGASITYVPSQFSGFASDTGGSGVEHVAIFRYNYVDNVFPNNEKHWLPSYGGIWDTWFEWLSANYNVGSGTWNSTFVQPSSLIDGEEYRVWAKVKDNAGNWGNDTIYFTYHLPDTTPPSVNITVPATDNTVVTSSNFTVQGTASDDTGIDHVDAALNGMWTTASGTTSWTKSVNLVLGLNTINAQSFDTGGNSSNVASRTIIYCALNYHWSGSACVANTCNPTSAPANSTACNSNPPAIHLTSWTNTCNGLTACRFTCNANYHAVGNTCVANVCATPAPGNSTICAGDNSSVPTDNMALTVVTSCTATKCEYTCNAGYHAVGNTCVANTCDPAAAPANSTACNANAPAVHLTTWTNTCSGILGCRFTCNATYAWNGSACVIPVSCGDGIVNGSDQCDDNNTNNGDGCSSSCQWETKTNTCDGKPGAATTIYNTVASYPQTCTASNGTSCTSWNPVNDAITQYDNAPANPTTTCQYTCAVGYTWSGGICIPPASCGNGTIDAGEQCDDSNTNNGDGCSSSCQWETKTNTCDGKPGDATTIYNTVPSYPQTCSASNGTSCTSWNPVNDAITQYDNAPANPTTTCQYTCAVGYTWSGGICILPASCGDGTVNGTDQCDDGNTNNGDGCTSDCKLENVFMCAQIGSRPDGIASIWNFVSSYRQVCTNYNFGSSTCTTWDPLASGTVYNETPSATICRYKCAPDYDWNGSECLKIPTPCTFDLAADSDLTNVIRNTSITFSAMVSNASVDCKDAKLIQWDWDGDGTYDSTAPDLFNPSYSQHTYANEGYFSARVKVTWNGTIKTATKTVYVGMSRREGMRSLYAAFTPPYLGCSPYNDVPAEDPDAVAIAAISDAGLIGPCGKKLFCPNAVYEKSQAAPILQDFGNFLPMEPVDGYNTQIYDDVTPFMGPSFYSINLFTRKLQMKFKDPMQKPLFFPSAPILTSDSSEYENSIVKMGSDEKYGDIMTFLAPEKIGEIAPSDTYHVIIRANSSMTISNVAVKVNCGALQDLLPNKSGGWEGDVTLANGENIIYAYAYGLEEAGDTIVAFDWRSVNYGVVTSVVVDHHEWACSAAKNMDGEAAFSPVPVEFKIDLKKPLVSTDNESETVSYPERIYAKLTPSDPGMNDTPPDGSGIKEARYTTDGSDPSDPDNKSAITFYNPVSKKFEEKTVIFSEPGKYEIRWYIRDNSIPGNDDSGTFGEFVINDDRPNLPPVIDWFDVEPNEGEEDLATIFSLTASDPNNDPLTYTYYWDTGKIITPPGFNTYVDIEKDEGNRLDYNNDGKFSANDANALQNYFDLSGEDTCPLEKICDLNDDRQVDAQDITFWKSHVPSSSLQIGENFTYMNPGVYEAGVTVTESLTDEVQGLIIDGESVSETETVTVYPPGCFQDYSSYLGKRRGLSGSWLHDCGAAFGEYYEGTFPSENDATIDEMVLLDTQFASALAGFIHTLDYEGPLPHDLILAKTLFKKNGFINLAGTESLCGYVCRLEGSGGAGKSMYLEKFELSHAPFDLSELSNCSCP